MKKIIGILLVLGIFFSFISFGSNIAFNSPNTKTKVIADGGPNPWEPHAPAPSPEPTPIPEG